MAESLLAEQVLLIGLDDEKGSSSQSNLHTALAGALLTDLAVEGMLEADEKAVHPVSPTEVHHPLLARAHEAIGASNKPRSAKTWVQKLPTTLRPFTETVADNLVECGILEQQDHRILGLFPSTRFPEADPEPERLLRARLHAVLAQGEDPGEHDALLLGLLEPLGMIDGLVDKSERKTARARAKEIAEAGVAGEAVGKVVQEIQAAAVAAAVAASTAATTAAAAGSA